MATRAAGSALRWSPAGLAIVVECFARFAIKGIGTPAPVAPTKHLVVSGLYRHVRNPMYVGVVAAILGQALYLGSVALLLYGAAVWVGFFAFVRLYEEPALSAAVRRGVRRPIALTCRAGSRASARGKANDRATQAAGQRGGPAAPSRRSSRTPWNPARRSAFSR